MTKLTVEEILDRVNKTETDRANYVKAAHQWQKWWEMDVWTTDWKDALKEGREQITLPTTYNVIGLAMRLFGSEPKIEVPSTGPTDADDATADLKARWLRAMFQVANAQQGRNVVQDILWQSLVRGRHAIKVAWIGDVLPEKLKDRRFKILLQVIDPLNVGIRRGPLYTDYAYHKYTQERSLAVQRYPGIKRFESFKRKAAAARGSKFMSEEVTVIDFWWTDDEGSVWNAVVVDDLFAKRPVKTDYPEVPIIEGYGDSAPVEDEELKGVSLLAPIGQLYQYSCRLASQIATGALYYFHPMLVVRNQDGLEANDFEIRPNQVIPQPAGTEIQVLSPQPNVPLAQALQGMVDAAIQQATFPNVMYGDAGNMQAGYGVSLLSDAARGRVHQVKFGLERTLESVCQLGLAIVEVFADPAGVSVWARSNPDDALYSVTLTPEDIGGKYDVKVTVTPTIPQDTIQRQTIGLRQVQDKIISREFYRRNLMELPTPDDEGVRVEVEGTLEDPAIRPKVMLDVLRTRYPNDWENIIKGTPLQQVADAEKAPPPPPPGMMGPPGPPQPPPLPPGPPPGMMGPLPPIQPPNPGLDGGGIPPELAGQMTPETMGLPPGMDPMLFAQLMGNPLPPGDELNMLGGT